MGDVTVPAVAYARLTCGDLDLVAVVRRSSKGVGADRPHY